MKNADSGLIALTEAFRVTKIPDGASMQLNVIRDFTVIEVRLKSGEEVVATEEFDVKTVFKMSPTDLTAKLDELWQQYHNS